MLALMRSGNACNMACDYCYGDFGASSDSLELADCELLAESLARDSFPEKSVEFLWHGGEPALLGPEKFEKMLLALNGLAKRGVTVRHGMQSNGLALTGVWPRLLAKYRVQTGISLDGPKESHDKRRKAPDGSGTYDKIIANVKTLKNAGVEVAILCTLGPWHEDQAETLINWLREINLPVKFNRLFAGGRSRAALPLEKYYALLKEIFKLALEEGLGQSIQPLEWMLNSIIHNHPPRECSHNGACGKTIFSFGKRGVIGKCTRSPKIYGNLHDSSLRKILETVSESSKRARILAKICANCAAKPYCNGGCPVSMGEIPRREDCEAIRNFYAWLSDVGLGLYLNALVKRKKTASATLAGLKSIAAALERSRV